MTHASRRGALRLASGLALLGLAGPLPAAEPALPRFREPAVPPYFLLADGFEADEQDVRRLLDSAGRELWRFFPEHEIEPFVVRRGRNTPIVYPQRGDPRIVVMELNTGETYWSQYAYQFAHELCHLLCGFHAAQQPHQWFEEALCETASLYTLRAMARSWRDDPPYPHWRDYSASLHDYAQRLLEENGGLSPDEIAALVRRHDAELRREPKFERVHAKTAVLLLERFEADPQRWEAVRWLNAGEPREGEPLSAVFERWEAAAPERQRAFVRELAGVFELP